MAIDRLHHVHMENGCFKETKPADMDEAFATFNPAESPAGWVLHFHGGIVNRKNAHASAEKLLPRFREAGAYPLFFIWETGLWETIANNPLDILTGIADETFFRKLVGHVGKYLADKFGIDLPFDDESSGNMSPQESLERWLGSQTEQPRTPFDGEIPELASRELMPSDISESDIERQFANDLEFQQVINDLNQELQQAPTPDEDFGQRSSPIQKISPQTLDELLGYEPGAAPADDEIFGITLGRVAWVAAQIAYSVARRFYKQRDHGFATTVIEEVLRKVYIDEIGRAFFWDQMKKDTRDAFGEDAERHGGTRFLRNLKTQIQEAENAGQPVPRVTLVGHSAGCIFISNFLLQAHRILPASFKFDVVLLAPAVDFDLFDKAYRTGRIQHLRLFGMNDELEQSDALLSIFNKHLSYFYPRSLLYFVSGLLETEVDRPLLGMQRFFTGKQFRGRLFPAVNNTRSNLQGTQQLVWSLADDGPGFQTKSRHHGDFSDEDTPTIDSVCHLIRSGFSFAGDFGDEEVGGPSLLIEDLSIQIDTLDDQHAINVVKNFASRQKPTVLWDQLDSSAKINLGSAVPVVRGPKLSDGDLARKALRVAVQDEMDRESVRELLIHPDIHPTSDVGIDSSALIAMQGQIGIRQPTQPQAYEIQFNQVTPEITDVVSELLQRANVLEDPRLDEPTLKIDDSKLLRTLTELSDDDFEDLWTAVMETKRPESTSSRMDQVEEMLQHAESKGMETAQFVLIAHRAVPTASILQRVRQTASKVDYRLTQTSEKTLESADSPVDMLVSLRNPDDKLDDIEGLDVLAQVGSIVSLRGTQRHLQLLNDDDRVLSIDSAGGGAREECQRSLPYVRATSSQVNHNERGDSAIVAIIDSGIDIEHHAFSVEENGNRKTRFHAIWDLSDPTGPPPPGFHQGTLHTESDLNQYLQGQTPTSGTLRDTWRGHGTHVASIAAGSPVPGVGFPGGVAPEAKLIGVITGDSEFEEGSPNNLAYSQTHTAALDFIDREADALELPVVINISQGRQSGSHDGSTLLETMFDKYLLNGRKPGRAVVKSAGNDRHEQGHATFTMRSGFLEQLSWSSAPQRPSRPNDRQHDVIELWFESTRALAFQLVNPARETTPVLNHTTPILRDRIHVLNHTFTDGNKVEFVFDESSRDNALGVVRISIEAGTSAAIMDGKWQLEIVAGQLNEALEIDAWVDGTDHLPIRFINHVSENRTLSIPGTAHHVITVGAIDATGPHVVLPRFSAYGATRDNREKPDLVAPGVNIWAARARSQGVTSMQGTSMAAPHVAGAIALVFSAMHKRTDLSLPNSNQLARAIETTTQSGGSTWDYRTGYGILDVEALLNQFLN